MRVLFFLALLLLWPLSGSAQPAAADDAGIDALIQLAQTRKCVRLIKDQGGRTLVNFCAGCRKVKISHQRPGQTGLIFRDRIVPGKGRVRVSMLGPGRTRVVGDEACTAESQDKRSSPAFGNAPRCVRLARAKDGGLLMVNTCDACKAVTVERIQAAGRRTTSLYAVRPGRPVPLAAEGAVQFRLPREQPCP